MSVPDQNIDMLWNLSREEFNEWRRKNDIPLLFDYFLKKLPMFNSWLNEYSIDKQCFLKAPLTGEWFYCSRDMVYVEYKINAEHVVYIALYTDSLAQSLRSRKDIELLCSKRFLPYLAWAKIKTGRSKFIPLDDQNVNYTDTFEYRRWDAWDDPRYSRAYLFNNFAVLKLGGRILGYGANINGRNLDFTDLDYLRISGGFHGSYEEVVKYSSCRNIVLKSADLNFFKFHECIMENFTAFRSTLYDFSFLGCKMQKLFFKDSTINKMVIRDSELLTPIIENTELEGFRYIPIKNKGYRVIADNYRRIRNAFQNNGKRTEAKEHYYQERCFELKALFQDIKNSIQYLFKWKISKAKSMQTKKSLYDKLLRYFKVVSLRLNYFFRITKSTIKCLISLFEYLLWGYGERPWRVAGNAIILIISFSLVYYCSSLEHTKGAFINSLYFSLVTFTTLGYGDIRPTTDILKMICGIEASIGMLLMALVAVAFANRSRY